MPALRPGCLLIARPSLDDPQFLRSIVYLLEHHDGGSLGLIINRPLPMALGELWEDCPPPLAERHWCGEGGPVERAKGLLLHGYHGIPGSFDLGHDVVVGGDTDALLRAIDHDLSAQGARGPRLFLGHSGWGPQQLYQEVSAGAWHIRSGNPRLLLDPEPPADLWTELYAAGNDPRQPGLN